jgi:hypothetical protein
MLATTNIQEASFLHYCDISFDILISVPPFGLFLIVFLYQYLLIYPSVRYVRVVAETSVQMLMFSF